MTLAELESVVRRSMTDLLFASGLPPSGNTLAMNKATDAIVACAKSYAATEHRRPSRVTHRPDAGRPAFTVCGVVAASCNLSADAAGVTCRRCNPYAVKAEPAAAVTS